MYAQVCKSKLKGSFKVPPSKSHSMRALILACFSERLSTIYNLLRSEDIFTALRVFTKLGCNFTELRCDEYSFDIKVIPPKNGLKKSLLSKSGTSLEIQCENSGTLLYFLGCVFSFVEGVTFTFLGDASLSQRPISPLLELYSKSHPFFSSNVSSNGNFLPLTVKGHSCESLSLSLDGKFSQVTSGLFLASAIMGFDVDLHLNTFGEAPYVFMTKAHLEEAGFYFETFDTGNRHFKLLSNGKKLSTKDKTIPSDWSQVSFPILLSLSTGSNLEIIDLSFDSLQGDTKILFLLKSFNARFEYLQEKRLLKIFDNQNLHGAVVDMLDTPDLLPSICGIAGLATGKTEIKHIDIARYKETNRVKSSLEFLSRFGVNCYEKEDSIIIEGKGMVKTANSEPINIESYKDHRIAMAATCFALGFDGTTHIKDAQCVNISFPNFFNDLKKCGVKLKLLE